MSLKTTANHPENVADEHSHLREMLAEIQNTLAQRQSSPIVVGALLDELREHCQRHFRHEEEGGYFSDAIAIAPRLSRRADALLRQHPEFTHSLDEMRQHAASGSMSHVWWERLCVQFDEFVCRFTEHERGENTLMFDAYCRDIGAED